MQTDKNMTETIYGQVIGKANHYLAVPDSSGGKRIIKDDLIRAYERSFVQQCKLYKNRLIDGRFKLQVKVYFLSSANDLDNAVKTILDCLQMCNAITNDNNCYDIHAIKRVDANNPRVVFSLIEEEPSLF